MRVILLALLTCLLAGCGATGMPKSGHAVVVLANQAEYANNKAADTKTGQACSQNILGLVATGDASVEAAKRSGGISQVSTISRDIFGLRIYIPIYAKSCTIIRGS